MKKYYPLLVFLLGFLNLDKLYSQCTPDTASGLGVISPDSATGIHPAVATVYYWQVINVNVPSNVMVPPLPSPIPVDSAGITGISGLPNGLTWMSNSSNNYWKGGEKGCFVISGTPKQTQLGVHHIVLNFLIHGIGTSMPQSYGYLLTIKDSIYAGIMLEELTNKFFLLPNIPNPFSSHTEIKYYNSVSEEITYTVFNTDGQRIEQRKIQSNTGLNTLRFDGANLKSGIYFYTISNKQNQLTGRFIIKK